MRAIETKILAALSEAATPGPWTYEMMPDGFPPMVIGEGVCVAETYDKPHLSDAAFIVAAVNYVRDMLAPQPADLECAKVSR